jgi:16S rRNA (guanine(527)-N(7))-methyltransferase RsmG
VFAELLRSRLSGIAELSDEQVSRFERHNELLSKWNRTVNLTSIRTLDEAVERHYCEAVFLAKHLPPGELKIVDIGSGAGFPGYPVAVLRPECTVTLVESHQRKSVFLREASRELANVRIRAVRVETVKEKFDWAISRAVSYEDLARSLKHIAPAVGLLTGAEEPPPGLRFAWQEPVALPWGSQRFLRMGKSVS